MTNPSPTPPSGEEISAELANEIAAIERGDKPEISLTLATMRRAKSALTDALRRATETEAARRGLVEVLQWIVKYGPNGGNLNADATITLPLRALYEGKSALAQDALSAPTSMSPKARGEPVARARQIADAIGHRIANSTASNKEIAAWLHEHGARLIDRYLGASSAAAPTPDTAALVAEAYEAAELAVHREKDHWDDDVSALTALNDAATAIRLAATQAKGEKP